jgi:hypothetical protein
MEGWPTTQELLVNPSSISLYPLNVSNGRFSYNLSTLTFAARAYAGRWSASRIGPHLDPTAAHRVISAILEFDAPLA